MTLNPIIILIALGIIAIGVYIRLKKHPIIPVITFFSLIALIILIAGLFIIDNTVLPTDQKQTTDFFIKLIVWKYDGTELNNLYKAFDILKSIVVILLLATQLSLFIETGLIIRHKKERH